jgi:hypothetical protein
MGIVAAGAGRGEPGADVSGFGSTDRHIAGQGFGPGALPLQDHGLLAEHKGCAPLTGTVGDAELNQKNRI